MNDCQHTIRTATTYETIVLPLVFNYWVDDRTLYIFTTHGHLFPFSCANEDQAGLEHRALAEAIDNY